MNKKCKMHHIGAAITIISTIGLISSGVGLFLNGVSEPLIWLLASSAVTATACVTCTIATAPSTDESKIIISAAFGVPPPEATAASAPLSNLTPARAAEYITLDLPLSQVAAPPRISA